MSPFDIFIAYISWGDGGKHRPVLVYALDDAYVRLYPITSRYDNKSEAVRTKYFAINDLACAGLFKTSYIDTGTRLKQSANILHNIKPIGKLSEGDKQRLIQFLQNNKK
ncbi:MAG: hypothetical protein FWE90_10120 [Defluviitaleaceae bacterium]|nr:hypothetical protein [Defluviitaleaceae bacterium]